jgi:hypothetical protein
MNAPISTTRTTTCAMCGASFEQTRFFVLGQERFANAARCLCSPCTLAYERQQAAEKAEREWQRMLAARLPSDYHRATVPNVPPCYARALTWDDRHARGGIGLIGQAGSGKSCALACLIMLRHQAFLWWSGTEARDAAIDAQVAQREIRADCRAKWEHAMRVPLLVLDDVSQGKMTEGWSSSLFDLLETRLSRSCPVLWTSQIGMPHLRAKIARQNGGDDAQADAITRRLSQHSLVLTI